MSTFNIVLLVIVLFFALLGLWRGLLLTLIALCFWVGAFFVGGFLTPKLDVIFKPYIHQDALRLLTSFYLLFFLTLVAGFIVKVIVAGLAGGVGKGPSQRVLGLILGVVQGFVVVFMLVFILLNSQAAHAPWFEQSTFATPFIHLAHWLSAKVF